MFNYSKTMFLLMLFLSSIVSISSNSWLGVWIGLEINLMSFIPLLTSNFNLMNTEAGLYYFLVQAFASTLLLFSIIFFFMTNNLIMEWLTMNFYFPKNWIIMGILTITLSMKLGAAPFHFWFPNVSENITWLNNMILMTWQKLAPTLIMSYILNKSFMMLIIIILSALVGAMGGFNQLSLRKLMTFSSIGHLSWMLTAMSMNEMILMFYFTIYSMLNISIILMFKLFKMFYMSQLYLIFNSSYFSKMYFLITTLSLGGLPPFTGFYPKWILIESMTFKMANLLVMFMVIMTLITLYYYLKITLASLLINYTEFNWKFKSTSLKKELFIMLIINMMSSMTLLMIMMLMYMLK